MTSAPHARASDSTSRRLVASTRVGTMRSDPASVAARCARAGSMSAMTTRSSSLDLAAIEAMAEPTPPAPTTKVRIEGH